MESTDQGHEKGRDAGSGGSGTVISNRHGQDAVPRLPINEWGNCKSHPEMGEGVRPDPISVNSEGAERGLRYQHPQNWDGWTRTKLQPGSKKELVNSWRTGPSTAGLGWEDVPNLC